MSCSSRTVRRCCRSCTSVWRPRSGAGCSCLSWLLRSRRTPLKTGTASTAKMVIVAITTSNSISVKARSRRGGELLIMDFMAWSAWYCAWAGSESENEPQKQDCLTRHFAFGVCRSCPTKSLFHLNCAKSRPRARPKIYIDRSTFQRGCLAGLHSTDWRHHFLRTRKTRQLRAFLRHAIDHFRGRVASV